jgi:hypothetical protein
VNAIVMGDFNCIVGEGSTDMVDGIFGLARRNDKGKILIEFCKQHDLVVMNTWLNKGEQTCTQGRGQETGNET